MTLRAPPNRATIRANDSFRNGEHQRSSDAGHGRTTAEQLALLLEDAADYREAEACVQRVVSRNSAAFHSPDAHRKRALLDRLNGDLFSLNAACQELEAKLRSKA